MNFFCDYKKNRGNAKGIVILFLFRLASSIAHASLIWKIIFSPYLIFYRFFVEWVLGCELSWKLKLGEGCQLYHGQGLVIHPCATIGSECILRHSTTIGTSGKSIDGRSDAPTIGSNVDIGCHVVIIGPISIGNNVVIGAGSVVIKSVPDNCVVAGNPARILRQRDGE